MIEIGRFVLNDKDIQLVCKTGAVDVARTHHVELCIGDMEVGLHRVGRLAEVGQEGQIAVAAGGHIIANLHKWRCRVGAQQLIFQRCSERNARSYKCTGWCTCLIISHLLLFPNF